MSRTSWCLITAILLFTVSCAGKHRDPLEHTRKLVKEGHASLYHNGAFRVPRSSIYLIPPAPETTELVLEMAGLRARQAFLRSLKQAAESVYIVSEGSKLTFKTAGSIRDAGHETAEFIRDHSREGSIWLLSRSWARGKDLIGESWSFSERISSDMEAMTQRMAQGSARLGDSLDTQSAGSLAMIRDAWDLSKTVHADRTDSARTTLGQARTQFVKGYLAVPEQLQQNLDAAGDHLDQADFSRIVTQENRWRKTASDRSVDLIAGTASDYTNDVGDTFSKVGDEWDKAHTTGIPLASLKALRWVLQGLFWDATIEPLAKMTAGGLGYIGVNGLAFPAMVLEEEGRALARIAVDVTWNTTRSVYDVTAPSGEAALAAVYGLMEYSAGPILAGASLAGGTLAGSVGLGAAKTGSILVRGGGKAAGYVGHYIGVPLSAAGVATAGTTVGLAMMGGGAVGSGTVFLGGETTAAASDVFGNIIAGSTLAAGTSASVGSGAAYGVYQLSKAVMVPSGYELGAGVVLSYETMSHLGAQSILAVSDCAYLVLSLEGPRWVLYAIKGHLGNGEDLVPGTVIDLGAMHRAGEEIYNLPVPDADMHQMVTSGYQTLPELKDPSADTAP